VTHRPPAEALTAAALVLAVLAVSMSGPLIAYAAAPALAIAFWRNALATGALAPAALSYRRGELRALLTSRQARRLHSRPAVRSGPRQGGRQARRLHSRPAVRSGPRQAGRPGLVTLLAGAALAGHFGLWVPSVKLTTVATATALVATQPVWQGLIARMQGRRLPPAVWVGIGIAVAGAVAATGADLPVSATAVTGDLLALAGGVAGAIYTAAGERVRATISTTSYTTVCYGVCAGALGAVCLLGGVSLGGYPATAWLAIVALVVGPQLLGHSMFSYALRRVPATRVSVLYLLEVPGAALIGWLWLGQLPQPAAWPGLAMLMVGVAVVILAGRPAALPPT
jgi:drug/metabolite transporter (DMT)-like permease